MFSKFLLSLACISFIASSSLHADETIDDDLSGFMSEDENNNDPVEGFNDLDGFGDDVAEETGEVEAVEEKASNISFNGNIAFKTAYGYIPHKVSNVEYSGFNQVQTALYLESDYKISDEWKLRISGDAFYDGIYDIHSDKNYNQDVLDTYQSQLRLDDTFITGRVTKSLDVKIGRQIVVWGKSDSIRVTDVINPLDNRLPGMTDIEDLRLSVGMAKFDYYIGEWSFSAMLIAESRIFLESAVRGEYFPVDAIFPSAPNPFIELVQPESSLDNMQYAIAANGVFSGWDLSFYGANVLDSKWHINPDTKKREVGKIQMLGTAINIATGSWLVKSEIAGINGTRYNSTTDEKQRLDTLVGIDYMGIKDSVLSIEVVNRHIFDYESQMSAGSAKPDYTQKDEVQTAMRATRSFQNDSINTMLLLSTFGHNWQYGGFFRASVEYDVADAIVANFGVIDYLDAAKKEDKPFINAISNNDKIFADITYSF